MLEQKCPHGPSICASKNKEILGEARQLYVSRSTRTVVELGISQNLIQQILCSRMHTSYKIALRHKLGRCDKE